MNTKKFICKYFGNFDNNVTVLSIIYMSVFYLLLLSVPFGVYHFIRWFSVFMSSDNFIIPTPWDIISVLYFAVTMACILTFLVEELSEITIVKCDRK